MKGKFVPDHIGEPQRVFIFAGSQSSLQETVDELISELKLPMGQLFFIWMIREENWKEVASYPYPFIILPPDYKDNPLTDDYRFRLLVETGHL